MPQALTFYAWTTLPDFVGYAVNSGYDRNRVSLLLKVCFNVAEVRSSITRFWPTMISN